MTLHSITPSHRGRFARALIVLTALLSSCCDTAGTKLPSPVRVKTTDEAATILITPSMVAPWSYVSAALKPAFTMTGDTAVGEVLPTTEQVQSQFVSALGVSLGVGLPGSSTASSASQTQATANGSNTTGGVTTTTASKSGTTNSTTTTTTTPGVAPAVPTGTPAGAQLPSAAPLTGGLAVDPVLKYKAAAYLNQEVQLLNQEIDNAAVRECFVPYVVKLKLAVMNYRPYLAYSLHTRISFVSTPTGETPPTPNDVMAAAKVLRAAGLLGAAEDTTTAEGTLSFSAQQTQRLAQAANQVQSAYVAPECLDTHHTPVVVPFLVADDMQMALRSQTSEVAHQIALALNLMVHGVGANAGLNNLQAALTSISSQDLSSVLTVARDNDNTLYVRIAPNNQASNQPSLIGQTYDVAVLLLVPRRYFVRRGNDLDPAAMSLVSYTEFRDASSGEVLAPQSDAHYLENLERILLPYHAYVPDSLLKLKPDQWEGRARPLLEAIAVGNYDQFRASLSGGDNCPDGLTGMCFLPPIMAPTLWAGMSSMLSDNPYKTATFQAPIPAKISIPAQRVLIGDDKVHPMQALVGGVGGLTPATLAAHLDVAVKLPTIAEGAAQPATVVSIPAQSLTLDPVAHVLTVTFPSLGKTGLALPTPIPTGGKGPPAPATDPLIAPEDPANALYIERVNCDPFKELCPWIDGPGGPPPGDWRTKPSIKLAVQLVSMPKAPAAASVATITAAGTVIGIEHGTSNGELPILVSLPDTGLPSGDTLSLTVAGAPLVTVANAAGTALTLGKHGYGLPQAGSYILKLLNLMPGTVVTVSIQAYKSTGQTDGDPATATYTAVPLITSPNVH